ncbi:MAG: hypothetical protein QNJ16_04570 [Rhodobacter sp.]|nr:hypothetical protein [Rhodobacter sp.]
MFRPILIAGVIAFGALSNVEARTSSDQLLLNVSRELPRYVQGVDPRDLRRSQLAAIYSIIHGRASESEKRSLIRGVIGGRFSIRGLLFQ